MFSQYLNQFPWHGEVEFCQGLGLRTHLANGGVPSQPGVYLIYGKSRQECRLLYVGKAGTMRTGGVCGKQGLRGRLCAKQDGLPRQQFFEMRLAEEGWDSLRIEWFVTLGGEMDILPAKAEADLLQIYYEQVRDLPPWNESI